MLDYSDVFERLFGDRRKERERASEREKNRDFEDHSESFSRLRNFEWIDDFLRSENERDLGGQIGQINNGPYNSIEEFRNAVLPLIDYERQDGDPYRGTHYNFSDLQCIPSAWLVYQRARNADPIFVLGRLQRGKFYDDSTQSDSEDAPLLLTESLVKNVGPITDDEANQASGGILKSNEWSPLVNDALILGAIHSGQDIYFASPISEENIHTDYLVVMGREVMAIRASGAYEFVTSNTNPLLFGSAARCTQPQGNGNFGFREYLQVIQDYLDPNGPRDLNSLWETAAVPEFWQWLGDPN